MISINAGAVIAMTRLGERGVLVTVTSPGSSCGSSRDLLDGRLAILSGAIATYNRDQYSRREFRKTTRSGCRREKSVPD